MWTRGVCTGPIVLTVALLAGPAGAWAASGAGTNVVLENDRVRWTIGPSGRHVSFVDKRTGKAFCARAPRLAVMNIKRGTQHFHPSSCVEKDGQIVLAFGKAGVTVRLAVTRKPDYFVLEVASAHGPLPDELTFFQMGITGAHEANWMSGAATDGDFAVAVRALNLKVQAGARGGLIRAMCCRRYGLAGAKVGLVGCVRDRVRDVLKRMIEAEGVPHSPLGGPWAVDAEENRGSYVFARVTEKNVDDWIRLARRGGFAQVHLCGWSKSLGHYEPRPSAFPNGLAGLKTVVAKLHAAGLKVGMHTLTGCISKHDPWVRPVPDPRLYKDKTFALAADVDPKATTIPLTGPPGNLHTHASYRSQGNDVQIGNEIVTYHGLSDQAPYGLTRCRRGSMGTRAAAHKKGTPVHHLFVRYNAYMPDENSTLVGDLADRIANVYNTCGFDMIYMDGAEGMGNWHQVAVMMRAIYVRLKRRTLVESSNWRHHAWPFHSRIGAWDHAKWGVKRFLDYHVRAAQSYMRGYLLPVQLGWWVILGPTRDADATTPDEIEYLCGKCLGYDIPVSLQGIQVGQRPANARRDELLTIMGRYERLRLARYFPDAVRKRLRVLGDEFRLAQAPDGTWQLRPTDYIEHKVTGLTDGTQTWRVKNRYAARPVRLRIGALDSAQPYDDPGAIVLADFTDPGRFKVLRSARGINATVSVATDRVKVGKRSLCFTATHTGTSRHGAWAQARKTFATPMNLGPSGALGFWLHGDGQGEVLNVQRFNPPGYVAPEDEHYVTVDFTGWRYVELHFRERDAARYSDYKWPYHGGMPVYRTWVTRDKVAGINVYYNHLPPGKTARCYLSPIKALPTRAITLRHPAVTIGARRIAFPVDLPSRHTIELDSPSECVVRDARGAIVRRVRPKGDLGVVKPGDHAVTFTCEPTKGYAARAAVTVITQGPPIAARVPADTVDWSRLRTECEPPRTVTALDGRENRWEVCCRANTRGARLEVDMAVESTGRPETAHAAPSAVRLAEFETLAGFADSPRNRYAAYVQGHGVRGVAARPGVTHKLARSTAVVKAGTSSARYTATSTVAGGWCARGKRFDPVLDLSMCTGVGWWIHGDRRGEVLKLQLRDVKGAWYDMVTPIDFAGWRYVEFPLGSAARLDLTRVEYLIVYYNAIPAGCTVTCHVDAVRGVRRVGTVRNPAVVVNGKQVVFPTALAVGDRLVYRGEGDAAVYGRGGAPARPVRPQGSPPALRPGRNVVALDLDAPSPDFRLAVSLAKVYASP